MTLSNQQLQAIVDNLGEGPDGRMGCAEVAGMAKELLLLREGAQFAVELAQMGRITFVECKKLIGA